VIREEMPDDGISISSGLFREVFLKRSHETPARQHPETEEDEIEKSLAQACPAPVSALGQAADVELQPDEKSIFELLSDHPISFDKLCDRTGLSPGEVSASLMMLYLDQLVDFLPGDRYVRFKPQKTQNPRHTAGNRSKQKEAQKPKHVTDFIEIIRSVFHGISRKCVQTYLAAYWCHLDRKRWNANSLFNAVIFHAPISHEELFNYVSPPFVKMIE